MRNPRTLKTLICTFCNQPYQTTETRPNRSKYCSRQCANTAISRDSAEKRGDKLRYRGEGKSYTKLNGQHMHRVVAEQKIGRKLLPNEIVHHIDGNEHNNNPDNLEVLESQAAHAVIHCTKNRKCEVAGCNRKHESKGMCTMHAQQRRKLEKQIDFQI